MTSSQRWKTFACFILIHVAALSGSAAEIRLKQRVESRGSVVLLGDIADVCEDEPNLRGTDGDPARGANAEATLARIELFPAPSESRWRTARRREIRELLGLHGVDLSGVRFSGAEAVIVETSKRPRPLHVGSATNAVMSANHQSTAAASAAEAVFPGSQPTGSQSTGSAAPPNELPNELPTTELVLAPLHNLRRGEIIRRADVAMIPVPVSGKGSVNALGIQPVVHTEEVVGMAVNRPIAANQPLDLRALSRPLLVQRGDLVAVTSLAPGVRVETVARAVDGAALGDLVLLESLVNRKKYTARVTGDKMAEIYASGIRVSSPPPQRVENNQRELTRQGATR